MKLFEGLLVSCEPAIEARLTCGTDRNRGAVGKAPDKGVNTVHVIRRLYRSPEERFKISGILAIRHEPDAPFTAHSVLKPVSRLNPFRYGSFESVTPLGKDAGEGGARIVIGIANDDPPLYLGEAFDLFDRTDLKFKLILALVNVNLNILTLLQKANKLKLVRAFDKY